MKLQLEITSEAELVDAAKKILETTNKKVWLFTGEMGAGKTTFIKTICKYLGVKDDMSSPSFSIVNEYAAAENGFVYHFDLYRMKSINELREIGFDEYVFSGKYCFVEWPQVLNSGYDDVALNVLIVVDGNKRIITWSEN
jgi:tRNA threonylcarbamoyladenosine biosynthesis protein TsaE